MLSPSRERVVCFEGEVAYAARFERACSCLEVRRLFSGSWSGMGQTAIRMCTTETVDRLSPTAKDRTPLACPRMRMGEVDTLF